MKNIYCLIKKQNTRYITCIKLNKYISLISSNPIIVIHNPSGKKLNSISQTQNIMHIFPS